MVLPKQINEKKLAITAWDKTSEDEDDVEIFTGIAHWSIFV